jgi:TM2 domain-containing membrane protein YozV
MADEPTSDAQEQQASAPQGEPGSKKLAAGICGILLGAFGVHKFILGITKPAIIMLVVSLVGFIACGIPTAAMSIIGIVEGIMYLTKSDEDFHQIYEVGKKGWF